VGVSRLAGPEALCHNLPVVAARRSPERSEDHMHSLSRAPRVAPAAHALLIAALGESDRFTLKFVKQ
jgi:predicted methyltransferase